MIWDISAWETKPPNRWDGWQIPECPADLQDEKKQLNHHLYGSASISKRRKDRCDWGGNSGKYTTADGYKIFAVVPNGPKDPTIWKNIWECKTLPKIDLFA